VATVAVGNLGEPVGVLSGRPRNCRARSRGDDENVASAGVVRLVALGWVVSSDELVLDVGNGSKSAAIAPLGDDRSAAASARLPVALEEVIGVVASSVAVFKLGDAVGVVAVLASDVVVSAETPPVDSDAGNFCCCC